MPNKRAKERKRQKRKLNAWLSANGRTANQYKKKERVRKKKGFPYGQV